MGMICELRRVSESQINELLEAPENVIEFLEFTDEDSDHSTDLDKAWHGIHFLLTGSVWEGEEPLNFLLGGELIGTEDVGYGPARALHSKQVENVDAQLSVISTDDFRRRFDPVRMTQESIYPEIWNRDPAEDDTLGYLVDYFETLKTFVHKARENKQALLIAIG